METKERIGEEVKEAERQVEQAAENLRDDCVWLISRLQEAIKEIDCKRYEMVNGCGIIQGNGASIELKVGILKTRLDARAQLRYIEKIVKEVR